MAWEEWDQIKSGVADPHAAPMQLNQLAPAGGGGGSVPGLAASSPQKQAAAKAINDDLEPGVARDGKHAAASVSAAVKEFGPRDGYGWDASGALRRAHETWEKQVRMLLGRLATEKGLLSTTAISFQSNEIDIATQLGRRSRIGDH
ncbi:hypothetical protein [Streptomyces sp. FIT100]|uniref:hypothetical protein n=1 Tax=Streptomyces sp. FIT100 TaxID=2837956 RepID=UPI0021C71AF4|nr:hypothetical protein [Streptomyces sp. FIT100]UUN30310.1 hypothetical protein KK483_31145 [Streptomyces sp. FIT100]